MSETMKKEFQELLTEKGQTQMPKVLLSFSNNGGRGDVMA